MARTGKNPYRRHGMSGGFVPDYNPKTTRNRGLELRGVVCPQCKAEPGHNCTRTDGTECTNVHVSRRRMAIRKYNEENDYKAADVAYAQQMRPVVRRAIHRHVGTPYEELAATFGIRKDTLINWAAGKTGITGAGGAKYGIWLREHYEAWRDRKVETLEDDYKPEPGRRPWRKCGSCGGTCHWHDTDWVCDDCGDEWNEEFDRKYAAPGTSGRP